MFPFIFCTLQIYKSPTDAEILHPILTGATPNEIEKEGVGFCKELSSGTLNNPSFNGCFSWMSPKLKTWEMVLSPSNHFKVDLGKLSYDS